MARRVWHTKDILLVTLTALVFGVVFTGTDYLYSALSALLTPLGLAPFANELLFGLWTMAASISGYWLKLPGAALFGELIASVAEALYGSYMGPAVILSGLIQGVGSEIGFAVFKYKRFNAVTLLIAAVGTTIFSFVYEFFKNGYGQYSTWMILALLAVRFLSVLFFNVLITFKLVKKLAKAVPLSVEER